MYIPLALVLNGRKLADREIRVKKCLESAEAIQKQKLMDAAMNGRKKGKKQIKRKIVVKEGKKEGKEKGEKKEVKEVKEKKEVKGEKKEKKEKGDKKNVKSDKKRKVDLSFMGNRTKLSINAINANRRLMKKMKK